MKFRYSIGEGNFCYLFEFNCYYLYVFLVCLWVYRVLIFRKLKGLENYIDVLVVYFYMLEVGWKFEFYLGSIGDKFYGYDYLY